MPNSFYSISLINGIIFTPTTTVREIRGSGMYDMVFLHGWSSGIGKKAPGYKLRLK
jgi:hypothetical protein